MVDAVAYVPDRSVWDDAMAAILIQWRQIENPTPSIDAYRYPKNSPAKFHPDPIWNDGALGFCEEVDPNNKKKNNYKMISDMKSVPSWSKSVCVAPDTAGGGGDSSSFYLWRSHCKTVPTKVNVSTYCHHTVSSSQLSTAVLRKTGYLSRLKAKIRYSNFPP